MSTPLEVLKQSRGQRIRSARKRAGLSHDRLAERVGSSRSHLIKLEKGLHLAGPALTMAIARETGVTVSYLEGEGDEEDEQPQMTLDDFLRQRITQIVSEVVHA